MKPVILLSVLLYFGLAGCQSVQKKEVNIQTKQIEVVRKYVDSCWNQGSTSLIRSLTSDDFHRDLNGLRVSNSPTELEAYIQNYIRAFPNLRIEIEEIFDNEHKVIAIWNFEGTNTGDFTEISATGKKIKVSGVSLIEFDAEGRMTREETYYNELYLLQQLGYTLNPPILQ
jgi:steroid delta-isomerase-like uncharacterized protein